MKKPHPCGNYLWLVTRLGADIGLTCQKCQRHVMLARSHLERRVKEIIPRTSRATNLDKIKNLRD